MADQGPSRTRSLIERLFDPTVKEQVAARGRSLAAAAVEAAEAASEQASATWRDAEPIRREAARAGRDALRWGRLRWRQEIQPGIERAWSGRTAALGAAGAAVPVAKQIIDDAAVRLGIRRRKEERHWGAFFVGIMIGAAAGVIAAMLTTPKAGRQMRDELAETARGAAKDAGIRAREVAARAREAAANAGEWVPIFQRPEATDGEPNDQPPVEDVTPAPRAAGRRRAPSIAPSEATPDA